MEELTGRSVHPDHRPARGRRPARRLRRPRPRRTDIGPHGDVHFRAPSPAADGPRLVGEVSSVNAPQGWKTRDNGMPYSANASNPTGSGNQSILLLEGPWGDPDLVDEMAERAQDDFDRPAERVADVTLDGETAYRLSGVSGGVPTDEIGLTSHDKWVQISVLSGGLDAQQR